MSRNLARTHADRRWNARRQRQHEALYADLVAGLRDLMSYTGGWDEPTSHPCGRAARLLARVDGGPHPGALLRAEQQLRVLAVADLMPDDLATRLIELADECHDRLQVGG